MFAAAKNGNGFSLSSDKKRLYFKRQEVCKIASKKILKKFC
jgi:hypothetical protein